MFFPSFRLSLYSVQVTEKLHCTVGFAAFCRIQGNFAHLLSQRKMHSHKSSHPPPTYSPLHCFKISRGDQKLLVLTHPHRLCKSAFNVCKDKMWRQRRVVWILLKMSTCSCSSAKFSRGWKQNVRILWQKCAIRPTPMLIVTSSWWEHSRENHKPLHVWASLQLLHSQQSLPRYITHTTGIK